MRSFVLLPLAAVLVLAGCGSPAPTAAPGSNTVTDANAGAPPVAEVTQAPMPTEAAAMPTAESSTGVGLSGEDFIAQALSLDGKPVTLHRCALMNETVAGNQIPCRVVDANDKDLKSPDGLPVDVFVNRDGLNEAAKTYLTKYCAGGFCDVQLAGTLKVSPETFFLEMSDVRFAPSQ